MDIDVRELLPERLRPLRRVEYENLAQLGRFEDERVELLSGMLVTMTPPGPRHASAVDRLTRLLVQAAGERAIVRVQNPLALSDDSEPEPDLALVRPGDYSEQHPGQAWLVIEVAESSQNKDRRIKAPLYAAAGVQEYWLVDVVARQVEVFREPTAHGYASVSRHLPGESVTLEALPGVEIAVSDIMG